MVKESLYSITYIIGLTPKIVFMDSTFLFSKEKADEIARQLREDIPNVEFHVNQMTSKEVNDV